MRKAVRLASARSRQALAVGSKEFRQIVRDRRTLLILIFVPALFLFLFGYALNFDIRHVRLAVQDRDRSTASRELVSAFVNSGYFDLAGYVDGDAELDRLIDESRLRAVLSVPAGFSREIASNRPVTVQVVIDGDNANTAATVMGYAWLVVAEFGTAQLAAAIGQLPIGGGQSPGSAARPPVPSISVEPRI